MRRSLLPAVLALAAVAPVHALGETSTWKIDPNHSHTSFTVKHLAISNVRGEFRSMSGTVKLDDKDVTRSAVEVTIDASSIDTRQPTRDEDLRSPNFFDVAKYPTITFKSTKVERAGSGRLKVTGDLTMHGVTRPVVLDVEGPTAAITDAQGAHRRGVTATTTINRKEFGLNWNKAVEAVPVVSDDARVEISAELVQQPASPGAQAKAEDRAAKAPDENAAKTAHRKDGTP